jgi:hypothetical protein
MTRDYIKSACVSHYHVIATIEIWKRSVEFVDAYSRDPVGCTRLGDIGLLYAKFGDKRKQCTTLGWRVRKLRQTCNLCTAKAKFMLDLDNP